VLGCLVAALLALAAIAAAPAIAQSGVEDEYDLQPTIPQANEQGTGGPGSGSQGAGGGNASGAPSNGAVPSLSAESSDDGGGVPVLLIILAVVAAACTAVAAWRLRQGPGSSERKSSQGAKPSPSAASETQL
jgi:hypothetical protein